MDYVVICLTALVASGLTLISGFGLGTLLLPAFALFFPIPVAVALTAIVHLLNNLVKLALVGGHADRHLVLRFGLPGLLAAIAGGWTLKALGEMPTITTYALGGSTFRIQAHGLAIGGLMIAFAIIEAMPVLARLSLPPRWLPVGGAVSGFVGGLSGHQGALRSAFLLRFKQTLTKESYIATGVVIACLVDVGRIAMYATMPTWSHLADHTSLLAAATGSAAMGAIIGTRLMHKITMRIVQVVVAVLLLVLGLAIALGVA